MKNRLIKLGIVLLLLFVSMEGVFSILKFKYGDGILGIQYLYEQEENSIDVLVLGSSHAFEDINTGLLFDEFGMSAYILAGSMQPYWNSYFYLQEALKKQTPQLVILESYASTYNDEYSDHSRIIKNNLGIKDFVTRYKALKVSSPSEDLQDYFWNYRLWHSRYEELYEGDFENFYNKPKYQYYKGFGMNFKTEGFDMPKVDGVIEETPIIEKSELYYRKIIETCEAKDIPIMVVVSPYILSQEEQQMYNYTKKIADEYGVPFVNFNSEDYYQKMGIDFSNDFADRSHLNYKGNEKYTELLAEEIKGRFLIDDHRGDEEYLSWELHSKDIFRRVSNYELKKETLPEKFIDYLNSNEEYSVVFTAVSGENNETIKKILEAYEPLRANETPVFDKNFYLIENGNVTCVKKELTWEFSKQFSSEILSVSSQFMSDNTQMGFVQSLRWNEKEYINDQSGCYVLVYDEFEKEMVCVKQLKINKDGECILVSK